MYVGRRIASYAVTKTSMYQAIQDLRTYRIAELLEQDLESIGIKAKVIDKQESTYIRIVFDTVDDLNLYKVTGHVRSTTNTINGKPIYRWIA